MNTLRKNKHIRSFVLRRGRMTRAQSKGLELYWSDYGIEHDTNLLNLRTLFSRNSDVYLDIGSGMGETTLRLAEAHPQLNFLAVEVHPPGVGSLLAEIQKRQLCNVRVIRHDVIEVLEHQIPDDSLSGVTVYFPDPWPKKRHHKRRLISDEFLALLIPKLTDNGKLYLATDMTELAEYMLQTCDDNRSLMNLAGRNNYSPRPQWRPKTKFEQRGLHLNHRIRDMIYCRREIKSPD